LLKKEQGKTSMAEERAEAAVASPWVQCDGQQFRRLIRAGLWNLEQNQAHVNALNVFPVPDGDTGTNMLLTMQSAWSRIEEESAENHIGIMADRVARGALMGARGNSGVILSQIWRGLSRAIKDQATIDAAALANGLQAAADTAYKGVMTPVEGTILTIIRAMADAAREAAGRTTHLNELLDAVLEHARQTLARTPEMLPVLKQAGVVDSGGQGLIYIFEGMQLWVRGDLSQEAAPGQVAAPRLVQPRTAQELARPANGRLENPYDVQFILLGRNLDVLAVRNRIDQMGDSTVVVGDHETIKVHVHVEDPGVPLSYGVSLGQITDVVVENMQEQMETIIAASQGSAETASASLQPGQIGIVAVTAGDGLTEVFYSLGATIVVNGGQTNNPSTEELFQAIQDVPSDRVILLPNNKNIIMAAEAAGEISPKSVLVVPTRTVPQGLGAMVSYDPDGEHETVAEAMRESADSVGTGELTIAVRDVELDGVPVRTGQYIGIADGKLRASGNDREETLMQMLTHLEMEEREILTLYYGADLSERETSALAARIATTWPDLDIEVLPGGQPHYHLIIGVE
jgi:DAK2 domain fusion protein YloV